MPLSFNRLIIASKDSLQYKGWKPVSVFKNTSALHPLCVEGSTEMISETLTKISSKEGLLLTDTLVRCKRIKFSISLQFLFRKVNVVIFPTGRHPGSSPGREQKLSFYSKTQP